MKTADFAVRLYTSSASHYGLQHGLQHYPPSAAFDGQYSGEFAHVAKSASHSGPVCPRQTPSPFSITKGVIQPAGDGDQWVGTVNWHGHVIMRNQLSMRVNGQIHHHSILRAEYQGPDCIVTYQWRKQPA